MKNVFKQRNLIEMRVFEIKDRGLEITRTSFNNKATSYVKFEDTGYQVVVIKTAKNIFLISAIFTLLTGPILGYISENYAWEKFPLTIAESSAVGAILFTILLLCFFNSIRIRTYLIDHENVKQIEFLGDIYQNRELSIFNIELTEKRSAYLLDNYNSINRNLSYESQYNKFAWLYNQELISSEIFQQNINELDSVHGRATSIKGFRQN
ncbi:MAG: hypothetical protein JWO03_719 [Bacteroidetes bacterium]|nr:hypothetical protein [Bacteroidota bacterium]